MRAILDAVTPLVEPLALDEAFLDVTGARAALGDGVTIAHRIREDVSVQLALTCSVGVAPNKFLAKLASVDAKPRATAAGIEAGPGVFEVRRGEELAYLHPLPVGRLWGVGPATLTRLRRMGVSTVGDLAALDPAAVQAAVGRSHGQHLIGLAAGRDERPVDVDRDVKSIGHEETFTHDLHDMADVRREVVRLADAVAARLRGAGTGARTLTLKVRDGAFGTTTRAVTLTGAVDTTDAVIGAVAPLLAQVDLAAGVRLLGISASKFAAPSEQLRFDEVLEPHDGTDRPTAKRPPAAAWRAASRAVDGVRERFGDAIIGPGSSVVTGPDGRPKVRLVRRGDQAWGPDRPDPDPDAAVPAPERQGKMAPRVEGSSRTCDDVG